MLDIRRPSAIAISLVLATGFGWGQSHQTHSNHHKPAKQLGKDLSQIRGKKGAARSELKATRMKAHGVKLDIMSVDNRLISVKDNLDTTRDHLGRAKQERAQAAHDLEISTALLTRTRRLVRQRIRHIYIQGQESPVSAVSGTRSGGEIAAHESLMKALESKDREVFNRYTALQKQVAREKQAKDETVRRVARLEQDQEAQTTELAETRKQKQNLLGDLRQKESDLEASIHQFEVDEEQIASEIAQFEREERARRKKPGFVELGRFSGRFSRPVSAPITSLFGSRYHPILHRVRMHEGIDFGASYGTPIHAAADGMVIFSSYMRGYGHVVILAHGGGYSTVYAHTSHVYCSDGQHVHRGQVIAAVGATGLATGPHLHFEVRLNGHAINPLGKL